ncbi:hypothetical protein [Entomomonas asaccharolytica]|uniref:Uncharacterized protein n=1 Tax=Entomomonas asaccharolytica TaxID=2785331 RepID=A0A974NH36_9GAMM|nr:hypothetical protein [Entomomonas asaccharolytica]QQP86349.1 hypothetical protein JHT90_03660 [Entomomonas asaccharolytica]
MKYLLLLISTFLFSNIALANGNAVKLCTDMLKQRQEQAGTPNKITDKQANTYCQCIVPKLEKLQAASMPSQQELNNLYNQCMTKAGIKPTK